MKSCIAFGRILLPVVVAFVVGACVSPVKVVSGLSDEEISKIGVNSIRVEAGEAPVDPALQPELQAALEKHLNHCEIVVKVDNFKRRKPGAVILLGDTNNLAGPVFIVSPNDKNRVLAEYYVDELQSGGGLIGLALLSAPEKNLSNGFAKKICTRIFKRPGVGDQVSQAPSGSSQGTPR